MSDWDDPFDVTEPSIGPDVAEAVLSGDPSISTGPELSGLGALFEAARGPATGDELAALDSTVSTFGGEPVTSAQPTTARTHRVTHKLTTRTAIAIGAAVLVSAGAVAAAGRVPSPFDSSAPGRSASAPGRPAAPDDSTTTTTEGTTTTTTEGTTTTTSEATTTTAANGTTTTSEAPTTTGAETTTPPPSSEAGVGPDAMGPAQFGLCTAWFAHQHGDDETATTVTDGSTTLPVPFANLNAAAAAQGKTVEDLCADATPAGKGNTAPGQSGDTPANTAPGHSSDTPANSAPDLSSGTPANTAPGHSSDTPANTAPGQSGDTPANTAPGHQPG
jgi:hypothetical protein